MFVKILLTVCLLWAGFAILLAWIANSRIDDMAKDLKYLIDEMLELQSKMMDHEASHYEFESIPIDLSVDIPSNTIFPTEGEK